MQRRGPGEMVPVLVAELPGLVAGLGHLRRGGANPRRLVEVDPVTVLHVRDGRGAQVLAALEAAEQVEQQALAQRAFRGVDGGHVERAHDADHEREAAEEGAASPAGEAVELDLVEVVEVLDLAAQALERLEAEASLGCPARALEDPRQRQRGAGAAEAGHRGRVGQVAADRLDPTLGAEDGVLHRLAPDPALGEEAAGPDPAAERQALGHRRHRLAAAHDLGAAAADVEGEDLLALAADVVADAAVDEPRLLGAGEDLDAVAEGGLGLGVEVDRVAGHAEGVGADRAHAQVGHLLQALAEARQRGHRAFHRLGVQAVVLIESGGEEDPLADAVDHAQGAVLPGCEDHVEGVRPQVDGGGVDLPGKRRHGLISA